MRTTAFLYLAVLAWLAVVALAPAALGWEPAVVTSDSMAPHIRRGDVILGAPYAGDRALAVGEVVTFADPIVEHRLVTHRVVRVADQPPGERARTVGRALVTQGDANGSPDPVPVPEEQVRSVGKVLVPYAGLPVVWAREGALGPLLVLGASVAMALGALAATRPTTATGWFPARAVSPQDARRRTCLRVATLAAVAAMVMAASSWPQAHAALVSTTTNASNSFDAGTQAPPTDLAGSSRCVLLNGVVDLAWTAADGATSYRIHRATVSGGPYAQIGTTTGTTFRDDTGLTLGATYYYVVEAHRASWSSPASTQVSVTTPVFCL